ncbi:hypothetical protein BDR22DRAFT_82752 [Usnea florida]
MVWGTRKQGSRSSLAQEKIVANTILVVRGSGFDIRNEIRHPRFGPLRGCQRLRFVPGWESSYWDEAMVSGLVSWVNGRSLAVPATSLSAVDQYYSRNFWLIIFIWLSDSMQLEQHNPQGYTTQASTAHSSVSCISWDFCSCRLLDFRTLSW